MNELPTWVYDFVRDLVEQEEVHPELLFRAGGMPAPAKYDWCPCSTLERVPAEIREHARVLNRYLKRPGPHPWREFNAHGNTCHEPGCQLAEDEHPREDT